MNQMDYLAPRMWSGNVNARPDELKVGRICSSFINLKTNPTVIKNISTAEHMTPGQRWQCIKDGLTSNNYLSHKT